MEKKPLLQDAGSLLREDASKLLSEEKLKLSEDECEEVPAKRKRSWLKNIPKRYILCFMVFSGFLIMNSERSCLSVAIVAMSSKKRVKVDGKWITKVSLKFNFV